MHEFLERLCDRALGVLAPEGFTPAGRNGRLESRRDFGRQIVEMEIQSDREWSRPRFRCRCGWAYDLDGESQADAFTFCIGLQDLNGSRRFEFLEMTDAEVEATMGDLETAGLTLFRSFQGVKDFASAMQTGTVRIGAEVVEARFLFGYDIGWQQFHAGCVWERVGQYERARACLSAALQEWETLKQAWAKEQWVRTAERIRRVEEAMG
jgi:hypothetical protein